VKRAKVFIKGNMSIPIIRIELPSADPLTDKQVAKIILDAEWDSFKEVRERILQVAKARLNKEKHVSPLFHYRSEKAAVYEQGRALVVDSWTKGIAKHSFGPQCTLRNDEVGIWKIGRYIYIVMKWPSPEPSDIPANVTEAAIKLIQ
jgi:hypothetical protein